MAAGVISEETRIQLQTPTNLLSNSQRKKFTQTLGLACISFGLLAKTAIGKALLEDRAYTLR